MSGFIQAVTSFCKLSVYRSGLFTGDDSFAGANFSARTAVDAHFGIDVVDVAFRDCFYGANGQTGAASHTRVSDYVSHSGNFLIG